MATPVNGGNSNPVAQTIIQQMGGPRIFAMAFEFAVHDAMSVTFHVAKALRSSTRDRVTHVQVTLDPDDTYTVKCIRVTRSREIIEVRAESMVYADQLRTLVEEAAGLRMGL